MKHVILFLLLARACLGEPVVERVLVLKPKAIHEEGLTLARGERVVYSVRCSTPVKFNIHFHEGEKVTYVRPDQSVEQLNGALTADAKREYWWMWTNESVEPVALYYTVRRLPKPLE